MNMSPLKFENTTVYVCVCNGGERLLLSHSVWRMERENPNDELSSQINKRYNRINLQGCSGFFVSSQAGKKKDTWTSRQSGWVSSQDPEKSTVNESKYKF